MKLNVKTINYGDATFPDVLKTENAPPVYSRIWALGDISILDSHLTGFICSQRCPGDIILKVYDLAKELRKTKIPIISGFHTPMEKECLDLLLRGKQPVVICPARSIIKMRFPKIWITAISDGRLLALSPFSEKHNRITAELSEKRNRFVSLLAKEFIVFSAPNSKTETFCNELSTSGKTVRNFFEV